MRGLGLVHLIQKSRLVGVACVVGGRPIQRPSIPQAPSFCSSLRLAPPAAVARKGEFVWEAAAAFWSIVSFTAAFWSIVSFKAVVLAAFCLCNCNKMFFSRSDKRCCRDDDGGGEGGDDGSAVGRKDRCCCAGCRRSSGCNDTTAEEVGCDGRAGA